VDIFLHRKNVLLDRFSSNFYCGQMTYLFSEMKKMGVTDFVLPLARPRCRDMACEFACAVRMHRNN